MSIPSAPVPSNNLRADKRLAASGQSVFGFLCRVGGTVVAMCSSLVIWYIIAEKRPGAIVFLWFFVFIGYYFFIKFPRFIPAVMIGLVTQVLIIGYELQVLTIGEAIAQRSGQPFYPYVSLLCPRPMPVMFAVLLTPAPGHIFSPPIGLPAWPVVVLLPSSGPSSRSH